MTFVVVDLRQRAEAAARVVAVVRRPRVGAGVEQLGGIERRLRPGDRDRAGCRQDKRGAGVSFQCLQIRHEVVDVLVGHACRAARGALPADRSSGPSRRASRSNVRHRARRVAQRDVKSSSSTSTPDTGRAGLRRHGYRRRGLATVRRPRRRGRRAGRGKSIRCCSSTRRRYFLPMPARSPVAEWHVAHLPAPLK